MLVLISALALGFILAGCGRSGDTPKPDNRKYPVLGKVVALDENKSRLTLDHQAIPGFMAAMTMSYPVKDPKEAKDLQPGDEIQCELIVDGPQMWLQKIVVTKRHAQIPEPQK
jgi:protein SCO1/2